MDKIAIIDNGGQYTHLIASKVRKFGIYSEIISPEISPNKLKWYKGIILSGSPFSVHDKKAPKISKKVFSLGIPILGICYGLQSIAYNLGGVVKKGKKREYGKAIMFKKKRSALFKGLLNKEQVWMSHGDSVTKLPKGFDVIASTNNCKIAAIQNRNKKIYGLQFHPEVRDTIKGDLILKNFVLKICGAKQEWNMKKFLENQFSELKEKIKDKEVLVLASGGVDSTVLVFLLSKIVEKQKLHVLHINNGFMRKKESEKVIKMFKKLGVNIKYIDAYDEFIKAIGREVNPEKKRKIIGEKFVEVSNREAKKIKLKNWLLAQGTIYPDTIESGGSKNSDVIKTHHNRVNIIQKMIKKGEVIEPLKDLYKAEVRQLGKELKLPNQIIERHPFPGPGLSIRVLGNEKIFDVSKIQKKVNNLLLNTSYQGKVLPIKSVGVKGDARVYEHPVLLVGNKNWKEIEKISTSLTNNIEGINRVIFQITQYEKMNPTKTYLTKERINKLREADYIVSKFLNNEKLYNKIWQFPVILLPLKNNKGEMLVLRPVNSERAMTASFSKIPWKKLDNLTQALLKIKGISSITYDVTNKPPATIEWE